MYGYRYVCLGFPTYYINILYGHHDQRIPVDSFLNYLASGRRARAGICRDSLGRNYKTSLGTAGDTAREPDPGMKRRFLISSIFHSQVLRRERGAFARVNWGHDSTTEGTIE